MPNHSQFSSKRLGLIREMLSGRVERGEIPGAVTLVSRRGETHVVAVGFADIESQTPIQRGSIFHIASMTKPITAVAAMILVEETITLFFNQRLMARPNDLQASIDFNTLAYQAST